MRWVHIASVVTLIGGFIYARFVLAPAIASAAPAERNSLTAAVQSAFRPLLFTVIATGADFRYLQLCNKRQLSAGISHVDGDQAAAGAAHPLFGDFGFRARSESGEKQPHRAWDRDLGVDSYCNRELPEVLVTEMKILK